MKKYITYTVKAEEDYRPVAELFQGARTLRLEAEANPAARRWKYNAVVMLMWRCVDAFCTSLERSCAFPNRSYASIAERLMLLSERLETPVDRGDILLIQQLTDANADLSRRKRRESFRSEVSITTDEAIDPSALLDLAPLWDDAHLLEQHRLAEVDAAISRSLQTLWAAMGKEPSELLAPRLVSYARVKTSSASQPDVHAFTKITPIHGK